MDTEPVATPAPMLTPMPSPVARATRFNEDELAPLRVLCLPFAGGSTRAFAPDWSAAIEAASPKDAPRVEIVGVDWTWTPRADDAASASPTTGDATEAAVMAVEAWADAVLDSLRHGFFDKRYVVFGHSLGALTALALVARLRHRDWPLPSHVFLSGAAPPALSRAYDEAKELASDAGLLDLLVHWQHTPTALLQATATVSDQQPDERHARMLAQLRGDLQLHNRLVAWHAVMPTATASFGIDTTVYGGEEDADVPVAALTQWRDVVGASTTVETFPGGHFFLLPPAHHAQEGAQSSSTPSTATATATASSSSLFLASWFQSLSLVSARTVRESLALVASWNATEAPYSSEKCLHELFAEAVARTPDAVAVCFEDDCLTFQQLDTQSELLAAHLYARGVRPNTITAIFMEHCTEFVVAYVAALKAGGAYMPLEIVYPPDLLARVLDESRPVAVLTKTKYLARLPDWQYALAMDPATATRPLDWRQQLVDTPALPLDRPRTHPDDLAYVVMSSGTTGTPKGICCPHRGAVHSYEWRLTHCPYQSDDRVACHVFFVWELLRPLLGNVPLHVIPDDAIYDPERLVAFVATQAITRLLVTPSLLQLVLDTVPSDVLQQQLRGLRLVWLCGEVVTLELRARFVALLPHCALQNLYSVSECHDVSAVDLATLSEQDTVLASAKYASCGAVMPNVRAYVLDDALQPVPLGVPGELYIGGPCLAIGYLNRPEQTAQRFLRLALADPSGPSGQGKDADPKALRGERVYRTGDRARRLPNGHLELIGRCDFMVKIRGYSVVLGAVEAALAAHALVSTAVVLTEGAEGEDKRLVAYIVPESWDRVPSAATLRTFLATQLPHYAIPAVFVQLLALPINAASGKLDRKQMPSADEARKLRAASLDATMRVEDQPQTATEQALAELWVDLLRLERVDAVSRRANFFDVGGHSLLATRLVSSIREAFSVTLTLADVLSAPELHAIAACIDQRVAASPSATASATAASTTGDGLATDATTVTPAPAPVPSLPPAKAISFPLEATLDASIYPAATRKAGYSRYRMEMVARPPRAVLLTGSTGFLGAHVLQALLVHTDVTVFCLVRAVDDDKARTRVQQTLARFALTDALEPQELEHRVVVLAGDLAKPLLGLSHEQFKLLASEVDAIIHNGADVNLVKPYAALKAANVLGTQEVLRLAVTNGLHQTRVKPVHYISTNGVFPSTFEGTATEPDLWRETDDLSTSSEALENGYAQSKWVAEQMCREAAQRGLPVSILRPGNMAPSSSTGQWNPSDFIYLLLKGAWAMGAAPYVAGWRFDLTPVDFAARAITHFVALHPVDALGQTLHIQNHARPLPGDVFMARCCAATAATAASQDEETQKEAAGSMSPPRLMPLAEWRALLTQTVADAVARDGHDAHLDLQRLAAGMDSFEEYLASTKVFDATLASDLLHTASIRCPAIDEELLAKYVAMLQPKTP